MNITISQAIILVLKDNPLSEGEIYSVLQKYGFLSSFPEIKLAIGKLHLLGLIEKVEDEYNYKYKLTDKGKKEIKRIYEQSTKPKENILIIKKEKENVEDKNKNTFLKKD